MADTVLDLGIGDDAAIVTPPCDRDLVLCMDTLVAGVHFPADTAPAAIGYKALAVNLSDLAAMGAEPAAGRHGVVIDHPQVGKTHMPGVVIITE